MIALLVDLINTNAITLFIRRLLIRPNFEQKQFHFSLELFSVCFLIWVKLWIKIEIILISLSSILNFRPIQLIYKST